MSGYDTLRLLVTTFVATFEAAYKVVIFSCAATPLCLSRNNNNNYLSSYDLLLRCTLSTLFPVIVGDNDANHINES